MQKSQLFCTALATLLGASTLYAAVEESRDLAPVGTRTVRQEGNVSAPLVAKTIDPFFQTLQPFSTNALPLLSQAKAMAAEEEYKPVIYGAVIASSQYTTYAFKQLPMAPGEDFQTVPGQMGSYFNQVTSGAESDGYFITNNLVSRYGSLYCSYYNAFDLTDWSKKSYSQSSELIYSGRDMTTDPTTGDVYGCLIKTNSGASYVLARVEYQFTPQMGGYGQFTGFKREAICDLDNILTALFFTADGQLWGIDMVTATDPDDTSTDPNYTKSASLYKIDKNTGAMELIGDTGVKPYYVSSACCDIYGNGKVYWSVKSKDNVGSLYTVDLETGVATKVMDYPRNEEVVAMFVPMQANGLAPAEPENFTADFPEGKLVGQIKLDIPTKTVDGSDLEGEVKYSVINNGNVIGGGTATAGASVAVDYQAANPGYYSFSARLENASGKGKKVSIEVYIGEGVPDTPKVEAAYADGKILVTWDPVTGAAYDRGYVDVDAITYTVTRYPDQTIVSQGKKDTTYEEIIPENAPFGYYTYGVTANIGSEIKSAEGKSGMVIIGVITPPFTETWDDTSLIGYGDNILKGVYPDYELDGNTLGHWYVHAGDKAATCSTGFGDENAWLLTPAFNLKAGKSYSMSFDTYTGYVPNTEDKYSRLEIAYGKVQNPDNMETFIMPEFTVTALKANKEFKIVDFTVPEDGLYYFGFHCCTRNGGAQVYLDNLTVSESAEAGFPGPCTDVKVVPETTGSATALITGKAPLKDTRNNALTGNLKITLQYEGEVVANKEGVAPGADFSFTYTVDKGAEATFGVAASNDMGESRYTTAGCYLGRYAPRPVTDTKLTRNDASKTFTVEWTAPTSDLKWNNITSADLSYKVVGLNEAGETVVVVDNISGDKTSVTFSDANVDFNGDPRFVYYGVVAVTNGGYSTIEATNTVAVGAAYPTPYVESFGADTNYVYSINGTSSLSEWYRLGDDELPEVKSYDGDNGFLGYFSIYYNSQGIFQTANIDLAGLDHPGVSFYMYNIYQNNSFDDNTIWVLVNLGGPTSYYVRARPDAVGDYGRMNSWCKYTVSLDVFKGMKVSLMIVPCLKSYVWSFIDNLRVDNIPAVDLSAGPIAGSAFIDEGESGLYIFNVINNGYADVQGATLDLMRNGKQVQTKALSKIVSGDVKQVQILDTPDVDASEVSIYSGVVSAEGEADASDNESDPIATTIMLPPYPTVSALRGDMTEANGVTLAWDAPEKDYVPNPRTETFEKAEPWATSVDGWTFIDRDDSPVNLGTANGEFGSEIVSGSKQSWFVMDVMQLDEQRQTSTAFQGHSGNKYLMKVAPGNVNVKGDDWAISPELYGDAQTVTLWAHSHTMSSPENIEGLYSEGSLDPDDFISVGKYLDVPNGWTMYSFDLPAGAKRFAIRANSQATFFLQVDDVTFQPMPYDLEIVGYNIWKNGERLNETPVAETAYIDAAGVEGDTYRVSPVYQLGEAVPGEPYIALVTGVENTVSDNLAVYGEEGMIIVKGALGKTIEVFAADGKRLSTVTGLLSNAIAAPQGVYIVKVGENRVKVIVK